ncbi:MAG: hypothetical protein GTN81_03745 [Proteobacteria bacterium]|nr:hypothetical protein [Pseudomonadota bacterium]
MKSREKWRVIGLLLITSGCAPLASRDLLKVSEEETRFYKELRPALVQAQDTFRVTSDALITSTTRRRAAIMRRQAAADRQAIYRSVAVPDPPTGSVEGAIEKLAEANAAVRAKTENEKEAGELRANAILDTFKALDTTLEGITRNQQAIHAYLGARRRAFGGPGRSAFLPYRDFADLRDYLRETVDDLREQFKLAKDLVDAARKEFGEEE